MIHGRVEYKEDRRCIRVSSIFSKLNFFAKSPLPTGSDRYSELELIGQSLTARQDLPTVHLTPLRTVTRASHHLGLSTLLFAANSCRQNRLKEVAGFLRSSIVQGIEELSPSQPRRQRFWLGSSEFNK